MHRHRPGPAAAAHGHAMATRLRRVKPRRTRNPLPGLGLRPMEGGRGPPPSPPGDYEVVCHIPPWTFQKTLVSRGFPHRGRRPGVS